MSFSDFQILKDLVLETNIKQNTKRSSLAESLNVTSIDSATVKRFRAFTLFLMIRESKNWFRGSVFFLFLRENMITMWYFVILRNLCNMRIQVIATHITAEMKEDANESSEGKKQKSSCSSKPSPPLTKPESQVDAMFMVTGPNVRSAVAISCVLT